MIDKRIFYTGFLVAGGLAFTLTGIWPFTVICLFLAALPWVAGYFGADAPTPPAKAERGSRSSRKGGKAN